MEIYYLDVEEQKVFFDRGPTDPDAMKMAYIATAKDLAKVKKYVELANYLLIDQEGDQLGPNGKITVIQSKFLGRQISIDVSKCP